MPMVSVIMPCYNHGKYVGEAISSVLSQTYTDFEFIIVENGSTDDSYDIISSFKDDRIHLIRLEKNDMVEAGRRAYTYATGKYIASMYSDDFWESEKLEKQVTALENNPEYKVSATWGMLVDEELDNVVGVNAFSMCGRSRLSWIRYLMENSNCFAAVSYVGERELTRKIFLTVHGYWNITDYQEWLDVLCETNVYMIEEPLVRARMHASNMNISYPSQENVVRTLTEYSSARLAVIEGLSDDEFREMYADRLIHPDAESHAQIICEKFFLLMDMADKRLIIYDLVINYFYRYYDKTYDGISVLDVMKEKYGYDYTDFIKVSGSQGYVALLNEYQNNDKRLRKIIELVRHASVIEQLEATLDECIGKLRSGDADAEIPKALEWCITEMIRIYDLFECDESVKQELAKMKRLCQLYQMSPEAMDVRLIESVAVKYAEEVRQLKELSQSKV